MLTIINPATEEVITQLEEDTPSSIAEKFERAQKAQKNWANTSLHQRLDSMKRFRHLIQEQEERLVQILTSEMGKPMSQSRNELKGLIPRIDFFLENVPKTLKEEAVFKDHGLEEKITHEPLGVIVNISAWNYPYFVSSNVFIPALLTGNAVLYKPSEYASLTGLEIAKLLHESGIPDDVFIPVIGKGNTGAELLKHPIQGLFFTGSYGTGKKIAEAISGRMITLQLELGGKDPVYVCEDVDLSWAAHATADGAFYNNGQSCCAIERLYVHQKIFDSFVNEFVKMVKTFRVGDPTKDETYIGPLARSQQVPVLESQVKDALKKGAKPLCGGKRIRQKGYFFEPTVFINVDHSMALMKEETFGPLIGIAKVADDKEAIHLMNDTTYGLTAGVYTKDLKRAEKILSQINTGSVYWNCCDRVSPRLPWSGRGHSGMGYTLSKYGILAFVRPKAWHLKVN